MTFVSSKTIAILLSSVLISTTALPVASAHADHKHHYKKHKHSSHHTKKHKHSKHKKYKKHHNKKVAKRRSKRSNSDDKIIAGILGFALGAIIVNEAAKNKRPHYQPTYHQPQPVYREPVYNQPNYSDPYYTERRSLNNVYAAPVYNAPSAPVYKKPSGPKVIRYEDSFTSTNYEPWTPEWQSYCSNKFRSFNPNTGTYRGYDGLNHFCIAK